MSNNTSGGGFDPQGSGEMSVPLPSGVFSGGASPLEAPAPAASAAIDQLNSLLRGTISATESYRIALERAANSDNAVHLRQLRGIQEEHGRACQSLRDRILELGGSASDSSGVWGVWAKTVTSVGSLFGDAGTLRALKDGEEHGLKDFQEALDDVDATSADLLRRQLIPAQVRHIAALESIVASLKK
jgi:hypothetical protein